jgi:hypothetical protein
MIAEVQTGPGIPSAMVIKKTDAAMAIALGAADKFAYISYTERDSAISVLKKQNAEATAGAAGQFLKAEALLFVKVNRLANLLRVEIAARAGKRYEQTVIGVGYSLLRYRDSNDVIIYDPCLVEAFQRALCGVTGDSALYRNAGEKEYQIIPAEPVVFTSMIFDDNKKQSLWIAFSNKVVNSFFGVSAMFEAATTLPGIVPVDVQTRDSIYALKKLLLVENYNLPAKEELKILFDVGIVRCVNGVLKRTPEGADLTLTLSEIRKDGSLKKIRSYTAGIGEDSMEALKKNLMALTKKLLRQGTDR